ncbi:TerC family protein [Actinoalloteichus hymeniacidonis]|uniref:Integral membrane protein, TerC family n=1 Tax=Actinoalloteichus hymeniacidonis TaxID=340345 RepID=A0AAC9HP99_9PSEU|nr:TerC family protein [Actinoalloteichus hymeniacidonis]AOS62874.1 integral membrane protein, TerC family [Actinoalloteichus hymeniacidonis]MBB5909093.1 tellurite resistance protein TerC [Actinoalloteichus hymeniacidonis]
MDVPTWVWFVTVGVLLALIAVDLILVGRNPHEVGMKEAATWSIAWVLAAVVFGIGLWLTVDGAIAGEFFAGYVTEKALSVDNLFIFVIIMSTFAVPKIHQHRVLLIGILLALVLRGIFIAVGAAAIERFSWVFYIFGGFLVYTAWGLLRHKEKDDSDAADNLMVRLVRRFMPVTEEFHGGKSVVKIDGKTWLTPMAVVLVAIASADLLFALDSIPAIFGLTQEPYLVFTANAFALMGLRQLYFLVGGLLNKLVYLSIGLSIILAFIGVKLVLHALHENTLGFINGGQPVPVPEVSVGLSLGVIITVLTVTTVASLWKVRRDPSAVKEID